MKKRRGHFSLSSKKNPRWSRADSGGYGNVHVGECHFHDGFVIQDLLVSNAGFDGTCLFFSDLHWNGTNSKMYGRMAGVINEMDADWLLFGGDLCAFMDNVEGGLTWLSGLKSRNGGVSVLGNRESQIEWHDTEFWRNAYEKAGFKLLVNEAIDAGKLKFFGIDDFRYGNPRWDKMPEDGFCVVLSHNPDAVAENDGGCGNISLCGHTHGGQIVWPLVGPLYTSSIYGRCFLHGMSVRDDGTVLYTGAGIGESGFGMLRRRLRCPREIVRLVFSVN